MLKNKSYFCTRDDKGDYFLIVDYVEQNLFNGNSFAGISLNEIHRHYQTELLPQLGYDDKPVNDRFKLHVHWRIDLKQICFGWERE